MQWFDAGSVGTESADEQQLGEDFDDVASELSSTPLAKSVTQVYLRNDGVGGVVILLKV